MRDLPEARVEKTRSVGDVPARYDEDAALREIVRAGVWDQAKREAGWGHAQSRRVDRDHYMRRAAWRVVMALLLALPLIAAPAAAQSDAVLLARTCVSERGWRTDTDDCAAIHLVASARAIRFGVSIRASIRALSPRLHGDPCSVSRRWLCDLEEDGHRPEGWERASWTRRRPQWLATLDEARRLLSGEAGLVCSEVPSAWGDDRDVARRIAAGFRWTDAECDGATFVLRFGRLFRRLPVDPE